MKNAILIIGGIFCLTNLILGLILTAYPVFNMWLNTVVIVANTLLLYGMLSMKLKDAYKIFLSLGFPFVATIELVLGLFANNHFRDNWYLVIIILSLMVKAILLITIKKVSQIN